MTYNGIAPDPRTIQEQNKDYQYKEIARGDIELKWVEKDILKNYPIQNQDGSLSCVAQATAKLLSIHEVVEGRDYMQLCPKFIYTRRENYPYGGMWFANALSIACKYGSCPEPFMPCDFKGETFMNDKTELAGIDKKALAYRAKYYFQLNINIDEIAEVLEQGYGVLLGFKFDYDEWTDIPHINPDSKNNCLHGVAAVDYMLYNGEKALLIEDSWGVKTGKGGRRIITEDFLMDKCYYAGFVTSLPNFQFTQFLRKGSRGVEVRKLQEVLQITVDGIFGPFTQKAVKDFQKKYNLMVDGLVGQQTRKKLNELL